MSNKKYTPTSLDYPFKQATHESNSQSDLLQNTPIKSTSKLRGTVINSRAEWIALTGIENCLVLTFSTGVKENE